MVSNNGVGFVGKVPSHGDFVSRFLERTFENNFVDWSSAGLEHCKSELQEHWLNWYLVSPVWRSYVSPGVLDKSAHIGVMIPSVDRVGRYFPFAIFAKVASDLNPLSQDVEKWLETAEDLAFHVLDESFNLDQFVEKVQALRPPLQGFTCNTSIDFQEEQPANIGIHFKNPDCNFNDALAEQFLARYSPMKSMFWTHGGERISKTLLLAKGKPPVSGFKTLVNGELDSRAFKRFEF